MRRSRPKNESRGGMVGGYDIKSISVNFDNLNHNFRTLNALSCRLVVNAGTLTVKNQCYVFAAPKTMILYIIRG